MKKVISIIIIVILLPILFVNSVIIINSIMNPDKIPSFFGGKPFIVLSGSMESEIFPGDLAIVKDVGTKGLKVNDGIAFRSEDIVVTHRIVEIKNENGAIKYKTKGDNNNSQDVGDVLPEQVEGLYKFKISKMGNLAMFMQTPTGIISCLSIPLLLLVLLHMKEIKEDRKYINEKVNKQKQMEKEIEELKKKNEELQKEKAIK